MDELNRLAVQHLSLRTQICNRTVENILLLFCQKNDGQDFFMLQAENAEYFVHIPHIYGSVQTCFETVLHRDSTPKRSLLGPTKELQQTCINTASGCK